MSGLNLFGENKVFEKLSQIGDSLEKLVGFVDWELFYHILNYLLAKSAKGPGGRLPYDYVLMFKILILQRYYNLSDGRPFPMPKPSGCLKIHSQRQMAINN
ncbi:transposase [Candidatus Enterococcus leclercqii]|uniref:transposase n=1 Tax=Candidatus Enterococcus leclercqii TaxID=1857218 RepID=UPI00137A04E0|nr:transposase [Enterococcus sp. CU9D]KAF1294184.1 hypothetical protein BAU14_07285 [Enterococcus sp. CU9D]